LEKKGTAGKQTPNFKAMKEDLAWEQDYIISGNMIQGHLGSTSDK
jgi:hypothetical protein